MMYNHVTYMEHAARVLAHIGHSEQHKAFAIASTAALFGLTQQLTDISFPALIAVDDNSQKLSDFNSDNVIITSYHSFAVLVSAGVNDAASQQGAKEQAYIIAKNILARMFYHQRKRLYGLAQLQRNGITLMDVGPTLDSCYGCLVSFSLLESSDINYNSESWYE